MKAYERIIICVVLVSALSFFGCKKSDTGSSSTGGDVAEVDESNPVVETKIDESKPVTDAKVEVSKPAAAAKVDESKPVAEVKAEAEKMDVSSLRATALSYKEAILSNEGKIKTLTEQLKKIPLTQQLGDEAKGLQSEITTLTGSVSSLLERFNIYYDKLNAMGGDVEGLKPGS
jgi:hypothetical protein